MRILPVLLGSVTEKVVRVPTLHATLLHALGLDHTRLSFPHEGDDTLTMPR